jgi:hypothetical protein
MSQEQQGSPIEEEAGGYGTPTVEQEMGGADTKKFAQPREEEAFDEAGLSQDSTGDGETFPAGAPDLSQFGSEDEDSAGEPGAGRFGGTEGQMKAENESTDPGFEDSFDPGNEAAAEGGDVVRPSTEAEMDEANTEEPDAGRPFSSEPPQEAAGLPDGSGTDLPDSKAPRDRGDDEESFDAG